MSQTLSREILANELGSRATNWLGVRLGNHRPSLRTRNLGRTRGGPGREQEGAPSGLNVAIERRTLGKGPPRAKEEVADDRGSQLPEGAPGRPRGLTASGAAGSARSGFNVVLETSQGRLAIW